MEEIRLSLNGKGHGAFQVVENEAVLGEMVVGISGNIMTVYHTEVNESAAGKGLGRKLLNAMTDHARKNEFKVIALCPYVHAQFKRRPDEYTDIWMKPDS